MTDPHPSTSFGVLVADDSTLVRNRLTRFLRDMPGIGEIREASGGADAIRKVVARPPDVLVLDVRMPGGNGLDALRTLRSEGCLPPLVVVWTNYADPHTRHRFLAAGAHGFFDKSTEFQDLLLTIREFVSPLDAA